MGMPEGLGALFCAIVLGVCAGGLALLGLALWMAKRQRAARVLGWGTVAPAAVGLAMLIGANVAPLTADAWALPGAIAAAVGALVLGATMSRERPTSGVTAPQT